MFHSPTIEYFAQVISSKETKLVQLGPFATRDLATASIKAYAPSAPGLRWIIQQVHTSTLDAGMFAQAPAPPKLLGR